MGANPYYHDVILQRLDSYLENNGRKVYYSRESFLDTDVWENIPLVFRETGSKPAAHPNHEAVSKGQLQDGERFCGSVAYAYIPVEGQPRLCAVLAITDLEVEQLARDGKLGLSTGFSAETEPMDETGTTVRIVGTVSPNHVLLFEQGVCPNCWPNDNAAMFENLKEHHDMTPPLDNETKGLLKAIHDKFCNTKPDAEDKSEPTMKQENDNKLIADLEAQISNLTNSLKEKDEKIANLEAAETQRKADAAWLEAKNLCPKGWVTPEKEGETRTLFENNKDAFYLKLMEHKEKFGNMAEGKPEGTPACGCPKNEEAQLNNIREDVSKACGFTIMEGD